MTIQRALTHVKNIQFPAGSPPVIDAVIEEIENFTGLVERFSTEDPLVTTPGSLCIAIGGENIDDARICDALAEAGERYIYLQLREDGSGWLAASHEYYLYSFVAFLLAHLGGRTLGAIAKGKVFRPAFAWQRSTYDYFLTQEGRIQKGLDREWYVQELARLGFTHLEVNGLAYPMALESGPEGETYPMFYTYCPALDQFVSSELNEGIYPDYYLSANLAYLKENARLATHYGLVPGLLCFEPRSVPERLLQKYPMLRGARVDHPFRSFQPRYNLTIAHPRVLEHYAELLQNLMYEVPELGYISIWTNDSGAGFEHTKSLYVGRNGGAYLIREWKEDAEIARVAGENALRFFRTLLEAGREINPDFRVMTRLESFYGEHDTIWAGLSDGLDAEVASLTAKGWDMPYSHPKYPDTTAINGGSIYQQGFKITEKKKQAEMAERDALAHFYFSAGPHIMFEPLLGAPYPKLTHRRLKELHRNGVSHLALTGGSSPADLTPFNINHEIALRFQFDPTLDIGRTVAGLAQEWAGDNYKDALMRAWEKAEEAILGFPNVTPLYSTHGFTWYRLWARPLVPNIEAIDEDERAYYERFMCTTPHNPNNVDLSRDVLFQLTTAEKSRVDVERIDREVMPPLEEAIALLSEQVPDSVKELGNDGVIVDQWVRLMALRCWMMTQRNVAAWIAGVYGYMEAKSVREKQRQRKIVREAMLKEMQNSEDLAELLETDIAFMALTNQGETPLVYGTNLIDHLERRIELMQRHLDDEPYIDGDYMWRQAGEMMG